MFTPVILKGAVTFSLSAVLLLGADPAVTDRDPSVSQPSLAQRIETRWTLGEILGALRIVETGGSPDEGRSAVGDGGDALGPFQIHEAFWRDAGVAGTYEDCRDLDYAGHVVVAYWRRYCPQALQALDAEVLARVHNGGPDGHRRKCTQPFWRKVERELVKQRALRASAYTP